MADIVVDVKGDGLDVAAFLKKYASDVSERVSDGICIVTAKDPNAYRLDEICAELEKLGVERAVLAGITAVHDLKSGIHSFDRLELYPDGIGEMRIESAVNPHLNYVAYEYGDKKIVAKSPMCAVNMGIRSTLVAYVPDTSSMPAIEDSLRNAGYKGGITRGMLLAGKPSRYVKPAPNAMERLD